MLVSPTLQCGESCVIGLSPVGTLPSGSYSAKPAPSPRDSAFSISAFPALKRWANKHRRYAALGISRTSLTPLSKMNPKLRFD